MRGVGVIFMVMKCSIGSIARFQSPTEITADKGNLSFGGRPL
jgi:hypothetical protein